MDHIVFFSHFSRISAQNQLKGKQLLFYTSIPLETANTMIARKLIFISLGLVLLFVVLVDGAVLREKPLDIQNDGVREILEQLQNINFTSAWDSKSIDVVSKVLKHVLLLESTSIPHLITKLFRWLRQQDVMHGKGLFDQLFVGVSRDCRGHILEWFRRIEGAGGNIFEDDEAWVLQSEIFYLYAS